MFLIMKPTSVAAIESPRLREGANSSHECGVKRLSLNMQEVNKDKLTCCDDFDTEDVEFDDEFSRFCRDASPFVVRGAWRRCGRRWTQWILLVEILQH